MIRIRNKDGDLGGYTHDGLLLDCKINIKLLKEMNLFLQILLIQFIIKSIEQLLVLLM
jgi:hypothetical protein